MSYKLIEAKGMTADIEEQMGLIQFLRHLYRRQQA